LSFGGLAQNVWRTKVGIPDRGLGDEVFQKLKQFADVVTDFD